MCSTVKTVGRPSSVDLDLWRRGSARLVDGAGRARVHELRNALNALALDVELLARARTARAQGSDGTADAASRAAALRSEIRAAGAHAAGLDALIAGIVAPSARTLPDVLRWALAAAGPVARRNVVALQAAPPDDLPEVDIPPGADVALGLLLVEACAAARRGSRCSMLCDPGPSSGCRVLIEWQQGSARVTAGIDLARSLLAEVLGSSDACSIHREGDRRRVAVTLEAVV